MALKATPDDQALLLDLQALDTKLAQLDHRAKSLAQHARLVQLATEVDALRQTELEQRGAREDVTIELSRLESDVAVVEARITRDTARAQSSSNAKDVQAFEHELGLLRKRQFDLEEIELTVMERLEERDTELAAATATLASVRAAIAELEAQRDAELATIGNERTHTAANRSTIVGRVPADLLALYEKQRSRYGSGASLLQHGSSAGVKLFENDLQSIRVAAPDDVLICPVSDAILVRTGESGL
jgi:hypothetical protein